METYQALAAPMLAPFVAFLMASSDAPLVPFGRPLGRTLRRTLRRTLGDDARRLKAGVLSA